MHIPELSFCKHVAINWINKEGNDGAGEKKVLANREPGKYYEKLNMPEVKLLCGGGARSMALDVGLDDHGIHL